VATDRIELLGIGIKKVNYRMRDAGFSRQRYWGEPFPVVWSDGMVAPLDASELPLELPHLDKYGPGPHGEGPLANIPGWVNIDAAEAGLTSTAGPVMRETSTMPGYAGSSWYFLRYMDPHNETAFCDRAASDYWGQVDLYIGGTEHAVGHLLYSRMWTKVLFDLGYIGHDEPYRKLVNQGMIQGSSRFAYRLGLRLVPGDELNISTLPYIFISRGIAEEFRSGDAVTVNTQTRYMEDLVREHFPGRPDIGVQEISVVQMHVDVNLVDGIELDISAFKQWRNGEYSAARFITEEDGKYLCGVEVEKMSKSKYNTVNPNELVERYGADTFRMYEMFLGPVEQSKPWDTKGIEGVHRFLRKLWRLFFDDSKGRVWSEEQPTAAEMKILHRTIKKIEEDTERLSFNTAVSSFMIAVNDLADAGCHKKHVLEPLLVLLAPYAPHISEELWSLLGNRSTVLDASFPVYDPALLVESSKEYPVSINGKLRTTMNIALDLEPSAVEQAVLQNEVVKKWLEGKSPKKIIYVKNKMVNVVI
jgi:leucyl-tRNA synthetase